MSPAFFSPAKGLTMHSYYAAFAAVFAALYAAHHVGDQWVQTHAQALAKGGTGWAGRLACARHVLSITITKVILLALTAGITGIPVTPWHAATGLVLDAASHYWADRRSTLARLAASIGKTPYYTLGAPRPGHDDNVTTGTGAYHLDQAFHIAFLWAAALIIAAP
jgi:hypothetical protein